MGETLLCKIYWTQIPKLSMEAGEENSGNANLKRQRAPLSDSDENVLSPSGMNDGQKRRRLEAAGQENQSPIPSSSGRLAELGMKPDTPMVPSVWSRVQQLTQIREGAPLGQRCLSDPGADSPTAIILDKGFKEHLLGEGEFSQRMERFKMPVFQAGPTLSPASLCPRTHSNLVSGIHQKLQGTTTPSSKQASRMRQEREQELNLLHFQPISENAWLKRSSSDPSLAQVDGDVEMRDGSFTEVLTSSADNPPVNTTDAELSSHDETDTTEIIDRMFEEVLQYAGRMEEERGDDEGAEDRDSGIGASTGDQHRMDTESEKLKGEKEEKAKEECDESKKLESNGDELLTFPPCGILSPLSKSVEAVVTPLRLAASQQSNPPSLLLTPEDTPTPPVESAPLYSIDAYRTQVQSKLPSIQRITPGAQRPAPEKSHPQRSVNTKERITALNEEAGKLQNVINQTLQALSCCTDEEHGRGSLEEAEAEKLLLVSCEKRSALLAEVSRLREERNSELGEVAGEDGEYVSQQPCRGTISITNIQLPLKVEFVCSSHSRTGRPSHYFFILIRYGPCNIIATPLATATDAQNGDTISFPTSVTLKDIRSSFEIDVEVYSLSHTSAGNQSMDRNTTKSRVTPRKLLNTITRSSNTLASASLPALNTRRSSNFSLVGSHKITLASLGLSKFPLDKMKLEGKIRRLLGDEFQEKVPFLSPLEGNIYLRLDSQSHSNVQHQGFLTIFELISGYGVWHRRYFVLESCRMYYWNHPNDRETKEAEGSISLSSSPSQCVRPVKRYSCARPFTFELVSNIPNQQQDDNQEALAKCWFSADTKQERLDWMEKLNQVLLDFHTWNRTSATQTESQQSNALSSGNLRESIL
ncbi:putative actin-binding protein anillin-like [Scophthalmus maximus]|uniref:Putative actin-binding protein anillin-like n=1 Tax=Scophthalmus maximus TaxID=52904 RepID=A0A2U9BV06_SCOMX|nr:putative actin-binding protein anillin-like [Scophthalmus maximus]